MTKSGVYAITNVKSNKVYIGSTNNFTTRWSDHKRNLHTGKHVNPHLQYSWDSYGGEMFEFSILECVDNLDKLVDVEQLWMDKYREEGIELYNCGLVASRPSLGRKMPPLSEEHKRKISESMMGRKRKPFTEEHRRNMRKAQYTWRVRSFKR